METRQRKRLRELHNLEDHNYYSIGPPPTRNEEKLTLGSTDNSVEEGPRTLEFDILIRTIKCPKLLRTCRLVCKGWNESACAVLRLMITAPVTIVEEYRKRKPALKKLEQLNESLKSRGTLPTPFRNVSFETCDFYFHSFLKKLNKDLILTELEIHKGILITPDCNTVQLMSALKSQTRSLEVLKLRIHQDQEVSLQTEDLEQLKFLNLKKFHINLFRQPDQHFCNPGYLKVLIRTIVHHSKLELLQLKCYETKELKELLSEINFDNVITLQLDSSHDTWRVSHDLIRVFASKPWHSLIRLNIAVLSEVEVEIVSLLRESLEMLDVYTVPLDLLPICPRLKEMQCLCGYSGQFLAEKFPSLRKFVISNHLHFQPDLDFVDIIPHHGVVQASITLIQGWMHPVENSIYCHFRDKWESWERAFPKINSYFHQRRANFCNTSTALRTIQKTFPNLKTLSTIGLRTNIEPQSYYGYLPRDIERLPIDLMIKEYLPFEDFLELESLDLHELEVNPGLIISNLSKIPKLKYLRIRRYKNLSSEIVRKYLGHLKEIAIEDCNGPWRGYYSLPREQRNLMVGIGIPLVKLNCPCETCNNPLCCCDDCHQYS